MPQPRVIATPSPPGKLAIQLRRWGQGRRGRVLGIEFGDKCFGYVERFRGAYNPLDLCYVKNQGDAVGFGIGVQGLADFVVNGPEHIL